MIQLAEESEHRALHLSPGGQRIEVYEFPVHLAEPVVRGLEVFEEPFRMGLCRAAGGLLELVPSLAGAGECVVQPLVRQRLGDLFLREAIGAQLVLEQQLPLPPDRHARAGVQDDEGDFRGPRGDEGGERPCVGARHLFGLRAPRSRAGAHGRERSQTL